MPMACNGDVRLYYEVLGDPSLPCVLLLNGAGRQCVDFCDEFCARIVERDFYVIRYDQRDTGLSSAFTHFPPNAHGVAAMLADGRTPSLPYDIESLASDAAAVLEAAGIDRVHLFGRSLGSAVAQVFAINNPGRVLSMTLAIAASRGIGRGIPLERLRQLDSEQLMSEDDFVNRQTNTAKLTGNPAYFDEQRIRAEAAMAFRRGHPAGSIARHFMVGLAIPDLRPRLSNLRVPVQVIHGRLDRIIPLELAEECAAAIPGAQLTVLEDMAHEGPPQLWQRWIDLFVQNAARI